MDNLLCLIPKKEWKNVVSSTRYQKLVEMVRGSTGFPQGAGGGSQSNRPSHLELEMGSPTDPGGPGALTFPLLREGVYTAADVQPTGI